LQLRAISRWLHIIVWPLALLPAAYIGMIQGYAFTPLFCWIRSCQDDTWCVLEHRTALAIRSGVHILSLIHMTFSIYVICQVFRYATTSQQPASRMVARKGLLYACGVVVVQLPFLTETVAAQTIGYHSGEASSLCPSTVALAGLLNMLVFMMNRRNMRTGYGRVWRRMLDAVFCIRVKEEPPVVLVGPDLFASTSVEEDVVRNEAHRNAMATNDAFRREMLEPSDE